MLDWINTLPEYFVKGVLQLLIITVSGMIVGWTTSTIFARRSEINAVEASLLKRKLDIYEEINGRLEMLKSMEVIPSDVLQAAIKLMEDVGIKIDYCTANQFFKLFSSPDVLKDEFLKMDEFLATKRIYFDEQVDIQTMRFMNYFGVLRRLQVMFEEQFIDARIPLDTQEVRYAERLLGVQLGMSLQSEFNGQIDELVLQLKNSIQNLSFAHRGKTNHTYEYYNDPKGPIMSHLKDTLLFKEKDDINKMVAASTAMGMAGVMFSGRKK